MGDNLPNLPRGWHKSREAIVGDVLIDLKCKCGGAWVLLPFVSRWSCRDCRRPGIRTGAIIRVTKGGFVYQSPEVEVGRKESA